MEMDLSSVTSIEELSFDKDKYYFVRVPKTTSSSEMGKLSKDFKRMLPEIRIFITAVADVEKFENAVIAKLTQQVIDREADLQAAEKEMASLHKFVEEKVEEAKKLTEEKS